MSAKKKTKGKLAKAVKAPKAKAGAKRRIAAAPKKRSALSKQGKGVAKKIVAKKPAAKKLAAKKIAAKKPAAKKLAAKKIAPKKLVTTKPGPKKAAPVSPLNGKPAMKRRDGAGHLDPAYEADLRARIEEERPTDDDRAFGKDALSDELGEEFVETVTSGEDEGTEIRDQGVTEELGGPFTVTSGGTEFARDEDESNPKGATREPFPRS